MPGHLCGKIVKHVGMVIMSDVIELDQSRDDEILQPSTTGIIRPRTYALDLTGPQMRGPERLAWRLVSHAGKINAEWLKASAHVWPGLVAISMMRRIKRSGFGVANALSAPNKAIDSFLAS